MRQYDIFEQFESSYSTREYIFFIPTINCNTAQKSGINESNYLSL